MLHDTIAAISTALSEGAVSIVRVSGSDAIEIVNRLFSRDLTKMNANSINYGMIVDPENGKPDKRGHSKVRPFGADYIVILTIRYWVV